jgi:protein subunit release factor B
MDACGTTEFPPLHSGDVEISFARSGGAGGQNVNKVNTKVDMRLKLGSEWLSQEMQDALLRMVSQTSKPKHSPRSTCIEKR